MSAVQSPTTLWVPPPLPAAAAAAAAVGKAFARNTMSNPTGRLVAANAQNRNLNNNKWSPWGWGGGWSWGPSPTKKPTWQPVNVNAWDSSWGGKDPSNWGWVLNGWNGDAWANDAWTGD